MADQLLEYRTEVDESNLKAECYFPGISYDDFDRAGNVSPWKICRILESGRSIVFGRSNFLSVLDLRRSDSSTHFVLGANYSFEPCLWDIFNRYHYFPYKITTELINLGQKSMAIKSVLINLLDNKQLVSCVCKLVNVDQKTKQPQNYPSWLRLKYESVPTNEDGTISVNVTSVPDKAFSWKFVVTASEIDHNGHTNQASYIRFFLDTAEMARHAKQLRHFTSDVCLYPITTLSIIYRKEVLCGQEVTASVWESDVKPSILHFAVRRGDDLAVVATASFRDNPSSKL